MTTPPPIIPNHPAHTLLARAHSPTHATSIFTDKIQHKPLHTHPTGTTTSSTSATDKRSLRRHIRQRKQAYHLRKQKPQPLTAKEKRLLHIHDLSRESVSYTVYKGLHELWNGYMLEILGFTRDGKFVDGWETREASAASQGSLLAAADFHGAELEVVRCVDVGKVGMRGVVVRDTKFTFVLVGEGDEVRRVMKRGAVFGYEVRVGDEGEGGRRVRLEVNGDALEYRPVDRAGRKFKWRNFEV